jgi:hypothetical protein
MKACKTLLTGLAFALFAPWALAAQPAGDTSTGTWKLNVAKSTFGSESSPKGETRIYSVTPQGTHVVIETEAADGKSTKTDATITYDGKPRPVKGNPDYDSAAATRIDRYETKVDLIRKGQVIGSLLRVVSQDGKTMTVDMMTQKLDGTTETAMSVYQRQ